MNLEAIHNAEWPSFKIQAGGPLQSVLFMILALSYIGLMLMLGARPMYVHLNETFLFKSIDVRGSYLLCDNFYYDLGHCPYFATIENPFLKYPRFLMILEISCEIIPRI